MANGTIFFLNGAGGELISEQKIYLPLESGD